MSAGTGQTAAEFAVLLEFDIAAEGFSADWAYCDRLSSYVARMIGHNRTDSLLYSNLFSSAFNELLETVYRFHRPGGAVACRVLRKGGKDRIELVVPTDESTARFYQDAVRLACDPRAAEHYRHALFADGPLRPNIGLLELAVDYGARLAVEAAENNSIRLVAELTLEDTETR